MTQKFAILKDGQVWYIAQDRPPEIDTPDGIVIIPPEMSHEGMQEYGIYQYEEVGIPSFDLYHTNNISYEILSDKVVGTWTSTWTTVEQMKIAKREEIDNAWKQSIQAGSFMSEVAGIRVDARRNDIDNDKDNLEEIINLGEAGLIAFPFQWKGVSDTVSLTLDDLKILRLEIGAYGLQMYQQKFEAFGLLEAATTPEEVMEVSF
ncbi:hypothetical protein [Geobacter sp. SVR]|uniref:hypothetical protein n=1 Tax=Geobacter sp. SVR TaxID=2495594 RepID=UPI00143EFB37|nr:hypothetical protein [Geobacter sp. SVR]BCS54055.1 hypothetical protein GSVR_23630 [Geobacter sp. SVR]GCF87538.1 hypothetical protein GSbR_41380 [Geobacter sp. SVR]